MVMIKNLLLTFLFCLFNICIGSKSLPIPETRRIMTSVQAKASSNSPAIPASVGLPQGLKLVIGAGGIYAAFLYYGTLQEDVFHYKAADGSMFKAAWFLQALGFILLSLYFQIYI